MHSNECLLLSCCFFPFCVCLLIQSRWDTWREKLRGRGREEKTERKSQYWPANELNQTLQQLSRLQYIKTSWEMKVQLHDNVKRLQLQHNTLCFWYLQLVCLAPTFHSNLSRLGHFISTDAFSSFITLPTILRNIVKWKLQICTRSEK